MWSFKKHPKMFLKIH